MIYGNPLVRRQQLRELARGALTAVDPATGATDRIGVMARYLERAYAAGRAGGHAAAEDVLEDGVVLWDAIQRRSRDALQDMAGDVQRHRSSLRSGGSVAILWGASAVGRRGQRVVLVMYDVVDDGGLIPRSDHLGGRGWPSTYVSALVRLGVFEDIRAEGVDADLARLTAVGLETMLRAIDDGRLFTAVPG